MTPSDMLLGLGSKNPIEIQLTGSIKGGPHDGARFTWKGTAVGENVFGTMAKMTYDGHVYTIASFDPVTKHVQLTY